MALTLADRIKQHTTSTGTGDVSFTGTPTGFATFGSVLNSGDLTYYGIVENDKWEVGIGTYGSDNMVRSYVLDSSNSGIHISLGGSGSVFVTYPADKSVYRDQESRIVVGPSGLMFDNGATLKDLKLTELTDVTTSGTIASTHVLALNNTNKSLLLGDVTGPSNSNNTLIGYGAGSGITSATDNVAIGTKSAIANNAGIENVSIGTLSGPSETLYTNPASYIVSIGHKAGSRAKSEVTAIGHQAGIAAYETGFVAVGSAAGSGIGSYSVGVGKEAAHGMSSDYIVAVGHQAAKSAAGESSVWIGNMAGISASSSTKSIGIGYQAGKSSSATDSIYIGQSAGQSSSDDDYLYISNGPPSSSRTLIKGDMQSKRLAVGAADVTLEDTFYIGIASSADKGLVVRSAAGQSDDLTQWQTSAGVSLASVSRLGVVTANQVVASGQGLKLSSAVPAPTTNILYNDAGTLKFNGSEVGGVTTDQLNYVSGIAVYASGHVHDDIYVSGIATYASGEALSLNAASGQAVYASGNTSNIAFGSNVEGDILYHNGTSFTRLAKGTDNHVLTMDGNVPNWEASSGGGGTSAEATYASGQAIENESDIVAVSGIANYASGQAIANEADITTNVTNIATNVTNVATNTSRVTYASGQAIANEADIATNTSNISTNTTNITSTTAVANYASGEAVSLNYASGVAAYASGQVDVATDGTAEASKALILDSAKSFTGVKNGTFNQFDSWLYTSGVNVGNSGVVLANNTPAVTTNTLYNDGGTLSWNGSAVGGGGGDVTTAQLTYVSGIAVYGSGQAQSLGYASGVAAYASGNSLTNAGNIVATSGIAAYASGQAIANEADIATNVTNIATNSARVTYASGLAITNESEVAYASGQAITNKADIATNTSNISTNVTNITSTTAVANYASGEALSLNAASGQVVYASGQAITNKANIATNTSNISTNTSNISTNTTNISTNSARVTYASGQAIANETDIATNVSNISTNTANIATNSARVTYASGLAITNESEVTYASGQAITNKANIATNTSNISTNTSNISTNTSNISTNSTNITSTTAVANYASGEVVSLNYASGVAAYASGQVNVTTDGTAEASKALILDSAKTFTGVKDGNFSQFDSWVKSSGISVGSSGIIMQDADLSRTITLKTPDVVSTSFTFPLPSGIGTNGQVLTTDSVQTYWSTVSASAAGSDGQIQYNNGGSALGGASRLYYNDTTNRLGIGTSSPAYGLDITGAGASGIIQATGVVLGASGIILSGTAVTASAAELNIMDGVTSTAAELNILDGVTSTAAELNILDGVTSTAAELNILDGVTATATEINLIDGVTATTAELNYVDVTAGTAAASKAVVLDGSKNIATIGTIGCGAITSTGSSSFATSVKTPLIEYTDGDDAITIADGGIVTFAKATKPSLKANSDGSTVTFDLNEANVHTVTLGANRTFAISNETAGQKFIIRVLQDGTGSRLVSTWFSTIKWAGGSAPTLTTTASKADVFGFLVTGTDTYDGFVVGQNI